MFSCLASPLAHAAYRVELNAPAPLKDFSGGIEQLLKLREQRRIEQPKTANAQDQSGDDRAIQTLARFFCSPSPTICAGSKPAPIIASGDSNHCCALCISTKSLHMVKCPDGCKTNQLAVDRTSEGIDRGRVRLTVFFAGSVTAILARTMTPSALPGIQVCPD